MTGENQKKNKRTHDSPLLSNPQLYALIVDNPPIGCSLTDRDGIILDFNRAVEVLPVIRRKTIAVESTPGKGSRFWFTLPRLG
jgi:PAS domain-containing protein